MKFDKLDYNNSKRGRWFLYGFLMCAVLLIIINMFLTKAKYKVVDNVKLVNSTINYSNADLNVIAMYKKEDDTSEYKPIEEIPTGNYKLSDESYCKIPNSEIPIKDKITYDGEEVNIKINKKGTKCYIYFDEIKIPTVQDILDSLTVNTTQDGCPEINPDTGEVTEALSKETSADLLCQAKDNDGVTYYFRGVPTNNWVKIDKIYWQIVRINGDGSIRLIYNGSSTDRKASDTVVSKKGYNENYNDNAYVGFMYGQTSQSGTGAYDRTHTNTNPSIILSQLQTWYKGNNLPEKVKDEYIDGNAGFCGDRTPYASESGGTPNKNSYGFGSSGTTYYGPYVRAVKSKQATFKCSQIEQDLYTTAGSQRGNQKLPVPVGLITVDEVMFAGGMYASDNKNYYLYNGQEYWTMSPYHFNGNAYVFLVNNTGWLTGNYVNNTYGMRPVINLKADTPFEPGGDGTTNHPFTVKLD